MKIIAAVARDRSGPFTVEELELEQPRDDEVGVRLVGAGICHTDLAMRAGQVPLPVVPGHEGAGVVERVGARVQKVAPSDHVVLSFLSCGTCPACQRGLPAYRENDLACNFAAARLDGSSSLRGRGGIVRSRFFGQSSFASRCLACERNVVKVRQDVPLELLGPLGCGIQAGAGAVLNAAGHPYRRSIAVPAGRHGPNCSRTAVAKVDFAVATWRSDSPFGYRYASASGENSRYLGWEPG